MAPPSQSHTQSADPACAKEEDHKSKESNSICNINSKDGSAVYSTPLHCYLNGSRPSPPPMAIQPSLLKERLNSAGDNQVFIIGIAGGSASGKTSVSEAIIRDINDVSNVVLISMDSFYKCLSPEASKKAYANEYNFDHPDAFEFPLLYDTLLKLKNLEPVDIPVYDFKIHSRTSESVHIHKAKVVIFEGILALYDREILDLMDMKIFVDTDSDVRLARRLKRDINERRRDFNGVLDQYNRFVKPSFDDFIQPSVRNADIIIPRGKDNLVAIDLITKHILTKIK
ncbi:Uridine kinase [Mitosporidium daphniae]|uniref:Uridine kinase n=1 Tax=Mitosporidium daphniae TaxID=1485682 RepID=A0A098VVL3_9MICR|nr:uridine kinase [Mitosporidium daphniae]KGG51771.1 uridine kinase [Mitosporidium daphniae]|eukprot:XP_013238198.1 uridine kinase [Mitosporidium daphniae]